jgi:hypothetical protein
MPAVAKDGAHIVFGTAVAIVDEVLAAHRPFLGADFMAYRNHVYRVTNLCARFAPDDMVSREKIAIAAAFHDLGIWTDCTFDYLEPSVRLATAYLARSGREHWAGEIAEMIREHHKLSPYRVGALPLVEPFRRADWIDVTFGLCRFGLSRAFVREIYRLWPGAGFHWRLFQLFLGRLRTNPRTPLPMVRW